MTGKDGHLTTYRGTMSLWLGNYPTTLTEEMAGHGRVQGPHELYQLIMIVCQRKIAYDYNMEVSWNGGTPKSSI